MANMQDAVADVVKAGPPVAVSVVSLFGMTLSDWAYILTILYTACMIADWVYKKVRAFRAARDDPSDRAGA